MNTELAPTRRDVDSAAELGKLKQHPKRRWSHRILAAAATAVLALSLAMVNAPTARADDCNYASLKWPWCEIKKPSIPRINVEGPRPDLTSKNSWWCKSQYIKWDAAGYFYWVLMGNTKHDITFWPDYYTRYYQLMWWDGYQWTWVPVVKNSSVIESRTVHCDA